MIRLLLAAYTRQKSLGILSAFLFTAFVLQSCDSDSFTSAGTSPSTIPNIQVGTEFSSINALAYTKDQSITLQSVTGIQVQKMRILIKELKLRPAQDSIPGNEKTLRSQPFVMEWSAAGFTVATSATIPAGNFDRLMFQIHRFTPPEANTQAGNEALRDFATSDRPTIIIEGTVTNNGRTEMFTYRSNVVFNLNVAFDQPVTVGNSTRKLSLQFVPPTIFRNSLGLLDPREPRNQNVIDNALRSAFRVIVK